MSVFMTCSDAVVPFGVVFPVVRTHKTGLVELQSVFSLKAASCPVKHSGKNKLIDISRFPIPAGNAQWFIAIDNCV